MENKNFMVKNMGPITNVVNYDFQGMKGKYFFGQDLGLTGCEGSMACLPAGKSVPFLHKHKQNEELYIVIKGNGFFVVDDEKFSIQEGSIIRVSPEGERCLCAGDKDLYYLCIQVKANSLEQATLNDGVLVKKPLPWNEK